MKKPLLSFAAIAALIFQFSLFSSVAHAQEGDAPVAGGETLVYDFTKLTVTTQPDNLNGSAAAGQAFYAWEKADKVDSKRQDYKGYSWKEGLQLPEVCHVWRRSDRFNNNVIPAGLKCPNDREMVIDGLQVGSVVKIFYDASATVTTDAETGQASAPKQIVWAAALVAATDDATQITPAVEATVDEAVAVVGETQIPSGAAITITKFNIDENHVGGYFPFKVSKGMVISKIEVTTGETTDTYDFTKLTVTTQPDNLNGSAAAGQAFYAWEKADKVDSKRQDYKGYSWKEGLSLPEVCHVWRRSDRINNNVVPEGLKCPNDREMVIDGLQEGAVVKIFYDASATVTTNAETGETSEPKQIIWAAALVSSAEDATTTTPAVEATVDGTPAVVGETQIPSGAAITITKFNIDADHVGGYFPFKVSKGMVISKIEITTGNAPSAINNVAAPTIANGVYYDLQGRPVANPTRGLYIVDGKKVVID
jgi:hypothetical protein